MTEMKRFIEAMPKAELHVHVEGTLEPELKFELARRNGIELPYQSVEEMRAAYNFDDLPSFLRVYYEGMSVLRTEQDFFDLTTAYLTKVHSQNVLYAEMFFDPQAHTTRGIALETVIRGIRRAQDDAQERLGIRTQLIMCFLRDMTAESAMATLDESLPHKDWIVGVGLDSDERGNPPVKFKEVFTRARAEGYRLTMHCDVDQENSTRARQCRWSRTRGPGSQEQIREPTLRLSPESRITGAGLSHRPATRQLGFSCNSGDHPLRASCTRMPVAAGHRWSSSIRARTAISRRSPNSVEFDTSSCDRFSRGCRVDETDRG